MENNQPEELSTNEHIAIDKEHIAIDREHIETDKKHSAFERVVMVSIGVLILVGVGSYLAFNPKTGDQIYRAIEPATVRVGVKLGGKAIVPEFVLNTNTGELELGKDFYTYPITQAIIGTGFIVNSNGHIVTNAHVVDTSEENIIAVLSSKFADDQREFARELLPNLDDATFERFIQKLIAFYFKYGRIDDLTTRIAVFDPNQTQGTYEDFINKGFPVQVIKAGESFPNPGIDLAVIKINRPDTLPTVKLGNSDKVQQGNRVYVLGYPGIADLTDSGTTKPTLTAGIVSAIKESGLGPYNVIQVDAAIGHGNSGGPAMDDQGRVIGIATFGATEGAGYNWILPINLVKKDLDELKIKYSTWNYLWHSFARLFAHQSGCHRWHSCPSDSGSYTCGDTGYCSECPNNYYCKNGVYSPGSQTVSTPKPTPVPTPKTTPQSTPTPTSKPTPEPTPLSPTPKPENNVSTKVEDSQTAYYKNPHWFREKLINDLVNEFGSQYTDIISRLVYTLLPDVKN